MFPVSGLVKWAILICVDEGKQDIYQIHYPPIIGNLGEPFCNPHGHKLRFSAVVITLPVFLSMGSAF